VEGWKEGCLTALESQELLRAVPGAVLPLAFPGSCPAPPSPSRSSALTSACWPLSDPLALIPTHISTAKSVSQRTMGSHNDIDEGYGDPRSSALKGPQDKVKLLDGCH
jgi:hypothetical protein